MCVQVPVGVHCPRRVPVAPGEGGAELCTWAAEPCRGARLPPPEWSAASASSFPFYDVFLPAFTFLNSGSSNPLAEGAEAPMGARLLLSRGRGGVCAAEAGVWGPPPSRQE